MWCDSLYQARMPCPLLLYHFFRTMEIHVGNRVAEVTLISKEGNNIRITVDGKLYEIDLTMQGKGRCSILYDGRSHNAELVRQEGNKSYDVHIDHTAYQVTIIDEQTKFKRSKQTANEKQDNRIIAPMPGKIIRIPVQKNDCLQAGETAIVLEAMKMQTNYKVTADCIVKDILVKEGDSVNTHQVLITLDILPPKE